MVRTDNKFNVENIATENAGAAPKAAYTNGILGGLGLTNLAQQGGIATNLAELKEKAEAALKAIGRSEVKVFVLDRDVETELAYSSIVYYTIDKAEKKYRYTINLLAGTGRKSLTAKETLRTAELAKTDKGFGAEELYTYADAIDSVLHSVARDRIGRESKEDLSGFLAIALDGIIFPYHVDPLKIIEQVSLTAANAIATDINTENQKGLSIPALKSFIGNSSFKYSIETHKEGYIKDRYDNPVKADFTATIELKDNNKNNQIRTVNRVSLDKKLVQTSGYITGYPIYRGPRMDARGQQLPEWEIAPQIVITNIRSYIADGASATLGIIAGALVGAQKQYIKVVMDTMTEDRNPGLYNLLTREVNTGTKAPKFEPINVLDPAYQPVEKAIAIDRLFSYSSPIITLDVTAYNEAANVLTPLVWAQEYAEARKEIADAANILTGGAFGNMEKIVFSKTTIPAGTYASKKEERDIRDLEFEKFISITKLEDTVAANIFFGSITPNNQNAFNEKIELLANYIPDASIDGKTSRIMLDPDFIKHLIATVQQSGLITQIDNSFAMPTTGFNTAQLGAMANYSLDQGFGSSLLYNVNPTVGTNGVMNYNSYNMYYGQ